MRRTLIHDNCDNIRDRNEAFVFGGSFLSIYRGFKGRGFAWFGVPFIITTNMCSRTIWERRSLRWFWGCSLRFSLNKRNKSVIARSDPYINLLNWWNTFHTFVSVWPKIKRTYSVHWSERHHCDINHCWTHLFFYSFPLLFALRSKSRLEEFCFNRITRHRWLNCRHKFTELEKQIKAVPLIAKFLR